MRASFSNGVPVNKIAAVEFQGEIGIFQHMPSQHQNNRFVRLDKPLLHQLFQPSQRNRRSRLATNSVCADFSFGQCDLDFRHLLDCPAGRIEIFAKLSSMKPGFRSGSPSP